MQIDIAVVDRDGVEKGKQRAPNEGAAARVEGITFGYDGEAYLRVHTYQSHLESEYSAEISQSGGAAPTPTAAAASAPAASTPTPGGSAGGGMVIGMNVLWLALGGVVLAGLGVLAYSMRKR
jgi:hypothetical protein